MMHRSMNIKFINAKQATEIHAYKNTKRKLYKTNAAIWFNKTWRDKQLTPNYINEWWDNKFCYKVASCWLFLLSHTTMHGSMNIK